MGQYIQIEFQNISQEQSDILVAQLNDAGFDGFEEGEHALKAFISSDAYDENLLNTISASAGLNFSKTIIQETNWNQLWESNFSPVIVDDFVAVRAHFHEPIKGVKFEIVITPKNELWDRPSCDHLPDDATNGANRLCRQKSFRLWNRYGCSGNSC